MIANAIGGMVEYAREGETGWLNRSCSAQELARIMSGVTERPEQIAELNLKLRARRDSNVKSVVRHGAEIDAVYGEVIGAHSSAGCTAEALPDEDPSQWPRISGVHGVFKRLDDHGGGPDVVEFFGPAPRPAWFWLTRGHGHSSAHAASTSQPFRTRGFCAHGA